MTKEELIQLLAGPLVEKWRREADDDSRMEPRRDCADELLDHLRESGVVERMRNEVLEEAAQIAERDKGNNKSVAESIRAAKAKLLGKGE